MTRGLKVRAPDSTNTDGQRQYGNDEKRLAECLAFLAEKVPDLAAVIDAWPALPEAIKKGILAMVRAGTGR